MINLEKLKSVLEKYKADFRGNWPNENYKWVAVKWFQDHWDLEAEDFCEMFKTATGKTRNLLSSQNYLPRKLIVDYFAKVDVSATREMFRALYDESVDLATRVKAFRETSDALWEKYFRNERNDHHPDTHAISTFLWLRYPDMYYIYMFSLGKDAAEEIHSENRPVANGSAESMLTGYRLYDEIREVLKSDAGIRDLFRHILTADSEYYADPELVTATIDFVYYFVRRYLVDRRENPSVNNPGADTEPDVQAAFPFDEDAGYMKESDSDGQTMEPSEENQETIPDDYSETDFLKEVYMSELDHSHLVGLLENKKNIILQGAPGVGKTFAAKRLAWSMMGKKDKKRVQMVQFHQSYSYDDFIRGYRWDGNGFALMDGVFYRFCKKAEEDSGNRYFFIIDEINRGNLSKIFGELLMLIENGYRGEPVRLAYNRPSQPDELFRVPENLYIIGTMNTVDRGLTKFDHALRQRFGVYTMRPAFESDGFKKYLQERNSEKLKALIAETKKLNNEIADLLGKDFVIGHRWFCRRDDEAITDEWLYSIVEYDILPLLEEYWFDQEENVDRWSRKLHEVLGVEDGR